MLRVAGNGDPVARITSSGWIWKLPALLCGRTIVCDNRLGNRHPSPLMRRDPGLRNALVQNFAGGNTMMLNRARIAMAAADEAVRMVLHDWWLYQLIIGAGGQVIYDEVPLLLYRQPGTNKAAAGAKLRGMLRGWFHRCNGINLATLAASADPGKPRHPRRLYPDAARRADRAAAHPAAAQTLPAGAVGHAAVLAGSTS
ncbi:hypothetical protein MASR2M74_08910 [Paracoccaceae bacterium]